MSGNDELYVREYRGQDRHNLLLHGEMQVGLHLIYQHNAFLVERQVDLSLTLHFEYQSRDDVKSCPVSCWQLGKAERLTLTVGHGESVVARIKRYL